jgi:general secretion pathway protein G
MRKGFTILEILVVLAVLAILISIAIPRIKGMQDNAKVFKAKSDLRTLTSAIEAYHINRHAYPTNITTDLTSATPQLLPAILPDPFSANGDTYQYSTSGDFYAISSVGMNGLTTTSTISPVGVVIPGSDDIVSTNGSDPLATAAECTQDSDCSSGVCGGTPAACRATGSGTTHVTFCQTEADCASGWCDSWASVCKASGAAGTGCSVGSDCASGSCAGTALCD